MAIRKYSLNARVLDKHLAKDAWWYENRKSIDVFVQRKEGGVVSCRINRAKLKDWLERTE